MDAQAISFVYLTLSFRIRTFQHFTFRLLLTPKIFRTRVLLRRIVIKICFADDLKRLKSFKPLYLFRWFHLLDSGRTLRLVELGEFTPCFPGGLCITAHRRIGTRSIAGRSPVIRKIVRMFTCRLPICLCLSRTPELSPKALWRAHFCIILFPPLKLFLSNPWVDFKRCLHRKQKQNKHRIIKINKDTDLLDMINSLPPFVSWIVCTSINLSWSLSTCTASSLHTLPQ